MDVKIDTPKLTKSIAEAQKQLLELEDALASGAEEFTIRLHEKLIENISLYGLGNARFVSTISMVPLSDGVSIMIGSEYAMFVEYGTGIVGSENPHPTGRWNYDVNSHGESGWWYPTDSSDPNPSKKMNKNGNMVAWTKGVPSRPFLYDTWLWGTRSASNIMRKHINSLLKE